MAARRLLIMMLVLLGISSVIAVIIPNPRRDAREREAREQAAEENRSEESSEQSSDGSGTARGADGSPAGSPASASSAEPLVLSVKSDGPLKRVAAKPGQHLSISVETKRPVQVIIPKLGLVGFADRWAPANFDAILPTTTGRVKIFTAPPGGSPKTDLASIEIG